MDPSRDENASMYRGREGVGLPVRVTSDLSYDWGGAGKSSAETVDGTGWD